ncbi:Syntaxin [Balamuthia mandrillaris]
MANYDRDALLGKFDQGRTEQKRPTRWGAPAETEETRDLDNRGLLSLQEQKMREQDKLLDMLGESVDRQKEIAIGIGQEVDEHNALLDDLDHEVERTNSRVQRATNRVTRISKKSSTTCLWIVICALFIALVLVIVAAFYF